MAGRTYTVTKRWRNIAHVPVRLELDRRGGIFGERVVVYPEREARQLETDAELGRRLRDKLRAELERLEKCVDEAPLGTYGQILWRQVQGEKCLLLKRIIGEE